MADFTCEGTPFQRRGAATQTALSPLVLRGDWGIEISCWEEDIKDLGVEWSLRRSQMHCGANPFRTLKTNRKY